MGGWDFYFLTAVDCLRASIVMTLDSVNQLTRSERDARRSVQLILDAVAWGGDFGRPMLFNAAIACDLKLTSIHIC